MTIIFLRLFLIVITKAVLLPNSIVMNNEQAVDHLLVVDDDHIMREFITITLESFGVERVTTAANGNEALAHLRAPDNAINLILCDLNMPGMDGIEFLRHLVELNYKSDLIFISAAEPRVLKTAGNLAQAHGLNVLGVLHKPITPERLGEALSLSRRFPFPANESSKHTKLGVVDLREALQHGEIRPYFQPLVTLTDKQLVGVESLARWHHPKLGMIAPDIFIPLAEQSDLIDKLTQTMVEQSLQQASIWKRQGLDVKLSINFSVYNLKQLSLPDELEYMLGKAGLDASQLIVEITESNIMDDLLSALDILTRLRLKGMGLAIDDFGTGYSSMQQLKRIPFTELKIDRLFVTGAEHDAETRAMLENHLNIANALQLITVAEGIETSDDWELLKHLGCDIAQGFFVARPMAANQLEAWLQKWQSSR